MQPKMTTLITVRIWQQVCELFGTAPQLANSYWREIQRAYQGKNRFYHNLQHIADLLAQAEARRNQLLDPSGLYCSIFYHDIVYGSLRKDNELKSAVLARQRLQALGLPPEQVEKCGLQIEATQKHQLPTGNTDPDLAFFLDFDLSILGAEWERYRQYTHQIRQEYRIYPTWMYRRGRAKVLSHFLERDRLYFTEDYFLRLETIARQNLERELQEM